MQLVSADTKEPFKEHTAADGQVYAEVEPDMDYFISLRSNVGESIKMILSVDGVNLGYAQNCKRKGKTHYCGHRKRKGDNVTMTALHFNKTREAHGVAPNMLTGKVEVKIHQRGDEYYKQEEDSSVSPSLAADSTLGGKKCVKSTSSGSHAFEKKPQSKKRKGNLIRAYKTGKHICTITLNYCSALGLIYNKILPPPPTLEGNVVSAERVGKKRKRSSHVAAAASAVSPEVNNSAADIEIVEKEKETETVTVQLSYDLVDLTGDD